MIEDIRWAKAREGDANAVLIVGTDGVSTPIFYKLQVLVDGVWLDLPRPEDVGESS